MLQTRSKANDKTRTRGKNNWYVLASPCRVLANAHSLKPIAGASSVAGKMGTS